MKRAARVALVAIIAPVALLISVVVGIVCTVSFESYRAEALLSRAKAAALVGKNEAAVADLFGTADRVSLSRAPFVHPSQEPPDEFITSYEYWALPFRALVAFEVYCKKGVVTHVKVDD